MNGMGQFGAPQKEKKHEHGRDAQASDESDDWVNWTECAVHVSVNIASHNQNCQLGNEETNNHQADHGANCLPWC
jgi:hypothetical protein